MDNNSDWYVINQSKHKYEQMDVYDITWTIKKFNELFATTDTISRAFGALRANKWQYCAPLNAPVQYARDYGYTNTRKPANIILTFKFTVTENVSVNCIPATPSQLIEDFGKLLTDDSHSDVTMESIEGEVFKAHKCVLAVRSKVFKAYFVHNMKEALTNVVETNLESEVLRELLTFIYTDKASQINDGGKLMAASDLYQLDGLKRICEEELHKNLNVENAIETLKLAELYSANNLKQLTMEFIKDGRAKLVIKTEGWKKNQSVELMKMIYELEVAD